MATDGFGPDAIPDAPTPAEPPVPAVDPVQSAAPALRFTPSLSTYQALAGFVATMLSIGGTGATLPRMLAAVHGPRTGNMAIVVQDAKAGRAVTNATIEILTTNDVLITTLTSNDAGLAQRLVREGQYRVRVRHPRYATDTQTVLVTKGERTTVPVRLRDVAAREDDVPLRGVVPSASPILEQRPRPSQTPPRLDSPPPLPAERTAPQAG